MIRFVYGDELHKFPYLKQTMFQDRADQFKRRLGWDVSVDLEAMAIGASAATLYGPIGAHLTRTGPEAWEILVLRSFADSLRQDLEEMAREFEA